MHPIDSASFGGLLRHYRCTRGLSLRALARAAGLDSTYLSRIERSALPPAKVPTVHRLARALDLDLEDESALIEASGRLPDYLTVVSRPEGERLEHASGFVSPSLSVTIHQPPYLAEEGSDTPQGGVLDDRILHWTVEIYGERAVRRADEPVIDIQYGARRVTISTHYLSSDTIVWVAERLVSALALTPDLMSYLLRENLRLEWGAFAVDDNGDIWLRLSLPGETCTRRSLKRAVRSVLVTADSYRDRVIERARGQRSIENLSEH